MSKQALPKGLWLIASLVLLASTTGTTARAESLRVRLLPIKMEHGRVALATAGQKLLYQYRGANQHVLRLAISVQDAQGRPVRGLGYEDCVLDVDGVVLSLSGDELRIEPTYLGKAGLDLALVFDVSASMYGAPLAECRAIASRLVDALSPADRAAVLSFADRVRVLAKSTNEKSVLRLMVSSLKVELDAEHSVLTDALVQALDAVGSSSARRAVVTFTDGENSGSLASPERVTERACSLGIPLLFVESGQRQTNGPLLERLASATGGSRLKPDVGAKELLRRIEAATRVHYLITVDTDKLPADGLTHRLRVHVARGDDSGSSEAVAFVTGVARTQAWAAIAKLLIPALIVVVLGVGLLLLTQWRRPIRRPASSQTQPSSAEHQSQSLGIKLCPVCRKAMRSDQTVCSCGYEERPPISADEEGEATEELG